MKDYFEIIIYEDTHHTLCTDKMEFPKLPNELKTDNSNILLWVKFINTERKEDFAMLAEKGPYIGSAYQSKQRKTLRI